jgi:hypothetical protein
MSRVSLTTLNHFLYSYYAHLIYPLLKVTSNGPTNTTNTKCEFHPEFQDFSFIDADLKFLGPAKISLYIDRRRSGSAVFDCERRN